MCCDRHVASSHCQTNTSMHNAWSVPVTRLLCVTNRREAFAHCNASHCQPRSQPALARGPLAVAVPGRPRAFLGIQQRLTVSESDFDVSKCPSANFFPALPGCKVSVVDGRNSSTRRAQCYHSNGICDGRSIEWWSMEEHATVIGMQVGLQICHQRSHSPAGERYRSRQAASNMNPTSSIQLLNGGLGRG